MLDFKVYSREYRKATRSVACELLKLKEELSTVDNENEY